MVGSGVEMGVVCASHRKGFLRVLWLYASSGCRFRPGGEVLWCRVQGQVLRDVVFGFQETCHLAHEGKAQAFQELSLLLGAFVSIVPCAHPFTYAFYYLRGFWPPASPGAEGCGCEGPAGLVAGNGIFVMFMAFFES